MKNVVLHTLNFLSGVAVGFTIINLVYDAKVRRMNERLDYYRRYQKL